MICLELDLKGGRGESSSLIYVLLCTYYLHLTIHLSSFAVAHSDQKDNDSDNNNDNDDDKEEEGSDNEEDNNTDKEEDNEEDSNTIMPPKLSKASLKSAKKLKAAEPSQPYSVLTLDGCMVKRYARGSNDWVVVEIYIPGVIAENAYTMELSDDDRKNLENKRLKKMLGSSYHIYDSCVIATSPEERDREQWVDFCGCCPDHPIRNCLHRLCGGESGFAEGERS